ncbi:chemotaxis protein CheA [Cognatilysobacter bugurensis]|uniref:Chemotaxis protein CheA n=1 Tax=Cognatilysobacter bugurensis TaxID=543356 RepID=A0A918T6A2_9GAMM|nr:chemotaxis protein CheA [Lysobacter bugurensis]GHA90355.1 chemotaxis protein CheA [Lysobacter bugurensis]
MDMSQFHAAFFEESREGLAAMETGLLGMEAGSGDAETINVIFRAAHSIKGGAATFGFKHVTQLTHVLETLLDEARSGKRTLDVDSVGALLGSVDVLRDLLEVAEHGGNVDELALAHAHGALEAVLQGAPPAAAAAKTAAPAADALPQHWQVTFKPHPSLFMSGNDPLRIVRELAELGPLTVEMSDETLPKFGEFDPLQAYLSWRIQVPGTVKRALVADAFAWVEDECDLTIEGVGQQAAPPAAPAPVEAAAPAAAAPAAAGTPAGQRASDADGSIRIATSKIDALINLVGELVITQSMLRQRTEGLDPGQFESLLTGIDQLTRNTRDLQEAVMSVRMLPVDFAFSRFPRMVRDLAGRLGKKVKLRTFGEATELDKGMIEKIVDPLVHLVRNAIDHGLEMPDERNASGKDETGTITLSAQHQGGHILIEITDDGRGMNRERILSKAREKGLPMPENPTDGQIWDLVFAPGFSTADALTDLSGRGVGMDVVKKNILSLGGAVEIRSAAGKGSTISIRLPLTLAILDGMTVAIGDEVFVVPLNTVIESLQPAAADVRTVANKTRMVRVRDDYVPMVDLASEYGLPQTARQARGDAPIAVVVESEGKRLALEVDDLLGQQQFVIKNLESHYRRVPGVSGATILGDGRVALIIDASSLSHASRLAA